MHNVSEKNVIFLKTLVLRLTKQYGKNLDFVGVYGSVARGQADNYSDVDVAIIMSDQANFSFDKAFIVDDGLVEIGYRIKSWTWAQFSGLIGTVEQGAILGLVPIYHRDYDAIERFLKIKREAESSLLLPLDDKKISKIEPLITELKVANSDAQTSNKEQVKYYAIKLLMLSCQILTELNCGYYRYSLHDRQKDIEMLSILPDKFINYYNSILDKNDEKDLKFYANEITSKTCEIFNKLKKVYKPEEYSEFAGFYEKFISDVNSKFIKSQIYSDKKLSMMVGYKLIDSIKETEKQTGVKFSYNFSDAFSLVKLPILLKSVKEFFVKTYLEKGIQIKKYTDITCALEDIIS